MSESQSRTHITTSVLTLTQCSTNEEGGIYCAVYIGGTLGKQYNPMKGVNLPGLLSLPHPILWLLFTK